MSDRGDFDLGQDGVMRALDDLFSPSTIAKQNVINILGVRMKYCAYILSSLLSLWVYIVKNIFFRPLVAQSG